MPHGVTKVRRPADRHGGGSRLGRLTCCWSKLSVNSVGVGVGTAAGEAARGTWQAAYEQLQLTAFEFVAYLLRHVLFRRRAGRRDGATA